MSNRDIGNKWEDIAEKYLKNHGYCILERNYTILSSEIDIIAEWESHIVFIEVKLRNTPWYGHPLETLTKSKRVFLYRGIRAYCMKKNIDIDLCRVDFIGLLKKEDGTGYRLWHIKWVELF